MPLEPTPTATTFPKSSTKLIGDTIQTVVHDSIKKTKNSSEQESCAYHNVDKYSYQSLTAVCNALGHIQDGYFLEIIASIAGLSSPICVKLKGGYIGLSNLVQIDQYSNNLTSACNVPGGDATIRHDRAKHALNDIFQASKLKTKVEDVRILPRELSIDNAELYATFTDSRAKRAVVPDITIRNTR
jgi:hypothetical protein